MRSTERRPHTLAALVGVILLGAALRIPRLADYRFHADEALFATLGRFIAQGTDPLLTQTTLLVDKPPLFYYTLAGGISMEWASELTARLPGLLTSLIAIALTAKLAEQLWRSHHAAVTAAVIMALSPFAVAFSPTVFADPPMVMWWLAALLLATRGRWGWAGVLSGLALATKQNALFLLPLVPLLGVVTAEPDDFTPRRMLGWAGRWLAGVVVVVVGVIAWEAARPGVSFWAAGVDVNNPGRLIRRSEVMPRLYAWWDHLGLVLGWPLLTACGFGAVAAIARRDWRTPSREGAITLVLCAFLVGYLALLWLVAFPTLDRYLLPVVPMFGLLVGRMAALIRGPLVVPLILLLVLPFALRSYPVGGDRGAHDGIFAVREALHTVEPGAVVYYQALGWPLHYYLFDAPVFLAPTGGPSAFAADLTTFAQPGEPRYMVLAAYESHTELLSAARGVGFRVEAVLTTQNRHGVGTLTLYRITPE